MTKNQTHNTKVPFKIMVQCDAIITCLRSKQCWTPQFNNWWLMLYIIPIDVEFVIIFNKINYKTCFCECVYVCALPASLNTALQRTQNCQLALSFPRYLSVGPPPLIPLCTIPRSSLGSFGSHALWKCLLQFHLATCHHCQVAHIQFLPWYFLFWHLFVCTIHEGVCQEVGGWP